MIRVIGGTSAYGSAARVHEQAAAAESPARTGDRRSAPAPGTMFSSSMSAATPTMRRGSGLTPMNFITGSVHIRWRLTRVLVREHALREALADDDDAARRRGGRRR